MLRLTTFGGVALRKGGELHTGAASQKRRLALLVMLAAAEGRPVRRDQLLAALWPEADGDHARHALRQALHALQRALETDALFIGTDALELDPSLLSSDVQDFDRADQEQALERLIGVYKGPFLDGFHVSDAPGFERWAEVQRARRATTYVAALEKCAQRDESRGDHASAVAWWRKLAAEEPLRAVPTLGVMRSLVALGDVTAALHFASVHEATVREELGVPPEPAVTALASKLRHGSGSDPVGGGTRVAEATRAPASKLAQARTRARDRQREWIERTLGARLLLEAGVSAAGADVALPAFDRERRLPVNVHLLDPGVCAVADVDLLLSRFERIVSLRDPRIVALLEYGNADGVVYYVTARPEGESLRQRLAREHQLGVGDAVAIAASVAAALSHAHAAGVLHADLRPKHTYVASEHTSVAALGIAEALGAATSRTRTSAALRMGSPAYQSPEQLTSSQALDPRSDIYSLGCMLYEMLAGEVPFASASPGQAVSAKLTGTAASLRGRRDTVSVELDSAVLKCLARSPSDRFRTADELRVALSELGAS